MHTIYFSFQVKQYSGYIISNITSHDQYYWFVFNDDEMIDRFGDSIAFYQNEEKLQPVYEYTNHKELVELIRQLVVQNKESNPA